LPPRGVPGLHQALRLRRYTFTQTALVAQADWWLSASKQQINAEMQIINTGSVFVDPTSGRELRSDIDKAMAGDYNPTRDVGFNPTSISRNHGGTQAIWDVASGFVSDVWQTARGRRTGRRWATAPRRRAGTGLRRWCGCTWLGARLGSPSRTAPPAG